MTEPDVDTLNRTPLYDLHVSLGARMVPFAGYSMPVQYEGIIAEHNWTREKAGLFDVSHMGQRMLQGPDHATVAGVLEGLTPGSFQKLGLGRMRYTLLLNSTGGIVDDLIVTRSSAESDDGKLFMVFNASRKETDDALVGGSLPDDVELVAFDDRALFALQGPSSESVLADFAPEATSLVFMTATSADFVAENGQKIDCHISRSGYTGEDGFEISVAGDHAEIVAQTLLNHPDVKPIGLGARDSLRLEAGLPLYGQDLDETTSPVEANLTFAISKVRRESGGFPGSDRILGELSDGPRRLRVGVRPTGRAPVRQGVEIQGLAGETIGVITSGGFGPTIEGPVAMGYVEPEYCEPETQIQTVGRRGAEPARIASLPFTPAHFKRIKA